MLLAVDVGNTNTVFAVYDGNNLLMEWRCSTVVSRTADEYYVWLNALINFQNKKILITKMIVCSVVPQVIFNLKLMGKKYYSTEALVVGQSICKLPVKVRVDEGVDVGSDRIVNTIAAFDRYGGNLIVVDFGTATTFDVVDFDGAYIGGAIAPGVNLSTKALHQAAAALPPIEIIQPKTSIGTNTIDCMQAGVFWGYIGLITEICTQIMRERNSKMKVIGTGGLATLFFKVPNTFEIIDSNLTTHGLFLIDEFNRK